MKLNRAYTQSLNDSIERIKLLFSDEEKFSRFNFTSKQFTAAIKAKQVKYAHNWFSVLRRAGVIRRISTVRGPVVGRYYCVENISSNYDKIAEEFGKMLASRGNDPYTEKNYAAKPNGITRRYFGRNNSSKTVIDKASFTKEQTKSNTTLDEEAAIKLLASLGYSVFKFSWIHTTQVDKNAVKVIGYYKLNKA